MNFKEAYKAMQEGRKVKRKIWETYWYYDKKTERCYSHINDKYSDRDVKEILFEDSLAEDWEIVEEKKEYWKPKENETFYTIDTDGEVQVRTFQSILSRGQIDVGNYFKTKEEAEHMVEKLKVIYELQKFAYENNEEKIDWNDGNQYKYYLIYDTEDDKIFIDYGTYYKRETLNNYFTSFKIAKKAIKTIGEDRIKKYYFDAEE